MINDTDLLVRRRGGAFRYQVVSALCGIVILTCCVRMKEKTAAKAAQVQQEQATAVERLLSGAYVPASEISWMTVGEPQFIPSEKIDELVATGHISEAQAQRLRLISDFQVYFRYEPRHDQD